MSASAAKTDQSASSRWASTAEAYGASGEAIGSGGQMSASCRNAQWQRGVPLSANGAIEASSISASAGLSSQRS